MTLKQRKPVVIGPSKIRIWLGYFFFSVASSVEMALHDVSASTKKDGSLQTVTVGQYKIDVAWKHQVWMVDSDRDGNPDAVYTDTDSNKPYGGLYTGIQAEATKMPEKASTPEAPVSTSKAGVREQVNESVETEPVKTEPQPTNIQRSSEIITKEHYLNVDESEVRYLYFAVEI